MPSSDLDLHRPFLRLFTANEAAIRAYVRRLVPARADADDIMQEVSVVLWEKFGGFDEGGDFRAWAFGVAKYEVLAWLRDKGRDRLVLSERAVELLDADAGGLEPRLERRREALEQCIGKVAPQERALLMRAYEPGVSMAAVAAESGRSEPGFYQWLYRMRKSLFDCIHRTLSREAGQ